LRYQKSFNKYNSNLLSSSCNQGIEWGADPASWRYTLTHQATLAHEPTPNLSTNGPPNPNLSDRYTTGVWPFITVPSHIIMGLEDQILRPEIAFDLLNAIPGSGLSQIRCAGHHSYIDKPAEYNEILRRFLKHL
jgi:pimeloyl-ACP methyl ester carboxylesterase